jgi:hypothetical protein
MACMRIQIELGLCRCRFYWLDCQRGVAVGVDPVRASNLFDLEAEVFDALLDACRMDNHEAAERLFKVWIKMPNQRPWPIGAKGTDA